MSWPLMLVAAALLSWPSRRLLFRVVPPPPTVREARWLGVPRDRDDPFALAAAYDLFAVCLRAGMPVGTAAASVAATAPASLARPLTEVADLLVLGADPDRAWSVLVEDRQPAPRRRRKRSDCDDHLEALAAMARRSARAGSSLSGGLTELAEDTRRQAHDRALAAAERAGVAISGPLGLCFLPAFICLGIVPVVIGLASNVLGGV